jgi:hypothetical protein
MAPRALLLAAAALVLGCTFTPAEAGPTPAPGLDWLGKKGARGAAPPRHYEVGSSSQCLRAAIQTASLQGIINARVGAGKKGQKAPVKDITGEETVEELSAGGADLRGPCIACEVYKS